MLPARANGETFVSATMCPRLPGPKESTSFQRASKRRTSVDPISQVARVPVLLGSLSNDE